VAFINISVDFKLVYNHFVPPKVILENEHCDKKNPIFDNSVIGKVVGCKYGNLPMKGFFKKDTMGDFYNCATVLVCLDKYKTANVKIFNNGKMQITGAPREEDGHRAVRMVGEFIKSMPFVNAPNPIQIINYKTEMINTCYELGFSINRETLYELLTKKFKLTTTYNTEGYPGVRLHYFYNEKYTGTPKEGSCQCEPCCNGKGTGTNGSNCRKLSIAIFQYGSVIIAGGCDNDKPILTAYHFVNKIISTIIQDIRKDSIVKKNKKYIKKQPQYTLISKDKINNQLYQLLLNKTV
jgi:TATA-box binding protein (TBP) (component of TFIID and TFIIIB)